MGLKQNFQLGASYGSVEAQDISMSFTGAGTVAAVAGTWNVPTFDNKGITVKTSGEGNSLEFLMRGYYLINYSFTTSGGSNDNFTIGLGWDAENRMQQGTQQFNSKAGDFWTTSGMCIIEVTATNKEIFFLLSNDSDTTEISITYMNVTAVRIGGAVNQDWMGGQAFGARVVNSGGTLSYAAIDTFYPFGATFTEYNACQMAYDNDSAFKILQKGYYYYGLSISTSGSSNDDLQLGVIKNGDTVLTNPRQKFISKGGSLYQTSLSCIFLLNDTDTIEGALANNTDTSGNTTLANINEVLIRMGDI